MGKRIKTEDGVIYLREYKNKSGKTYTGKTWYLDYYDKNGNRIQESSHSRDLSTAKAKLKIRAGRIAEGREPGHEFEKTTFWDLKQLWERNYPERRNRWAHMERLIGHLKAKSITATVIKAYIRKRREEGTADGTIHNELADLRHAFNLAKDEGLVSPEHKLRFSTKKGTMVISDNPRDRVFEPDEFLLFIEHLRTIAPHLVNPSVFAYWTGWRENQVFSMKWNWVKEGRIIAPRTSTKHKKTHPVMITELIRVVLEEQKKKIVDGSQYVFNLEGEKINMAKYPPRRLWSQACREAGVGYGDRLSAKYAADNEKKGLREGPTFHSLRATFVTDAIGAEVDYQKIGSITGHQTIDMIKHYTKLAAKHQKEAFDKVEEYRNGDICDRFCDRWGKNDTVEVPKNTLEILLMRSILLEKLWCLGRGSNSHEA